MGLQLPSPTARRLAVLSIVAALVLISACGTEVGRVPCSGSGETSGTVKLESAQPVAFWTQLDANWEGDGSVMYKLEIREGEEVHHAGYCDALAVHTKINSKITNLGGKHTRSYQGKMQCDAFTPPAAGSYDVHYELVTSEGMNIDACDLVLKQ
jgi:hypothetical protein